MILPAAAAAFIPQQEPGPDGITATDIGGGGMFGAENLFGMILEAGPVSWLVLLTLLGFSLVSWAIIFTKWRQLRGATRATAAFLAGFRKATRFADAVEAARKQPGSPLSHLLLSSYDEIYKQSQVGGEEPSRLRVTNMEAVARSLLRAETVQTERLERRLTFLATTGGATPFIGLFGTVWGIMTAFQDIGLTQAANISVVAPGVSEALIATAAGLAAAIPAVIAYNSFLGRIRRLQTSMDDFSMEYTTMLERYLAA